MDRGHVWATATGLSGLHPGRVSCLPEENGDRCDHGPASGPHGQQAASAGLLARGGLTVRRSRSPSAPCSSSIRPRLFSHERLGKRPRHRKQPPPQPMRCVGGPRATVPRVLRRGGRWLVHWEPGPRLLATSRRLQGALLPPPRLPTRRRSTSARGAASKDSGRPLGWRLHREKRAWYWGARGGREARRLLFGSYEAWVPPRMSRRVPCGRLVAAVRGAKIPSGLPTTRRCERGEGGRRAAMCGQPRASQLHGRRADACGEGACCVRVVVGLPVAAPRA